MVKKEDVFLWFRDLDAANRLNLMHGLLNMCHPVELRFLGSCMEDLCKKDYLTLRERTVKANTAIELLKLNDVNDDVIRTQLILACALLQTSNRACATTIYNIINAYLPINPSSLAEETAAKTVNEIILLMNMAIMHPAFTYEQKRTIEHYLKEYEDTFTIQRNANLVIRNEGDFSNPQVFYNNQQATVVGSGVQSTVQPRFYSCNCVGAEPAQMAPPAVDTYSTATTTTCCSSSSESTSSSSRGSSCSTRSFAASPKAQIKMLELKNAQRKTKKPNKRIEYRIQVTWSSGEVTEICKTHQELVNFHQQLISFQDEPGHKERYIPYFTGPKPFVGNKNDDPNDEGMGKMADYLKQLMVKVPHNLLDSELVTKFFRGQPCTNSASENGVESSASASPSSLPANSPPPNLTTASTSSTEIVDNVDLKMKNLSIQNYVSEAPKTYQPLISTVSRPSNEDRLLEQVFFRERMAKDLEELLKKFDKKQLVNLSESDLIKEGFEPKKAKQIISRIETFKLQLPNGMVF